MKALITGGVGFIGAQLARALLDRGVLSGVTGEEEAIDELVLFDSVEGPGLSEEKAGGIVVRRVVGDVSDQETVRGCSTEMTCRSFIWQQSPAPWRQRWILISPCG